MARIHRHRNCRQISPTSPPQGLGDFLQGLVRRAVLAVFEPADVSLVQVGFFRQLHLVQTGRGAKLPDLGPLRQIREYRSRQD